MQRNAEHQKLLDDLLFAFGSMPNVRVWVRNVGVGVVGDRVIRYGIKGESDIDGIVSPNGRRLCIEVKTGKAVLSLDQKRFRAMILRFGGIYIEARSVEQALHEFKNFGSLKGDA